jgi:hypothetical protein
MEKRIAAAATIVDVLDPFLHVVSPLFMDA